MASVSISIQRVEELTVNNDVYQCPFRKVSNQIYNYGVHSCGIYTSILNGKGIPLNSYAITDKAR